MIKDTIVAMIAVSLLSYTAIATFTPLDPIYTTAIYSLIALVCFLVALVLNGSIKITPTEVRDFLAVPVEASASISIARLRVCVSLTLDQPQSRLAPAGVIA